MQKSEADTLIRFILGTDEGDEAKSWRGTLSKLDASAATQAVLHLSKLSAKLTMQAFRAEYDNRLSVGSMVPLPALAKAPKWVQQWYAMRQVGDDRALIEQKRGYDQLGLAWPDDVNVVS